MKDTCDDVATRTKQCQSRRVAAMRPMIQWKSFKFGWWSLAWGHRHGGVLQASRIKRSLKELLVHIPVVGLSQDMVYGRNCGVHLFLQECRGLSKDRIACFAFAPSPNWLKKKPYGLTWTQPSDSSCSAFKVFAPSQIAGSFSPQRSGKPSTPSLKKVFGQWEASRFKERWKDVKLEAFAGE